MVHLLKNILTKEECRELVRQFDIESKLNISKDDKESYGNTFGFGPSNKFNLHNDKIKQKILEFFPENTLLENVHPYVRKYSNDSILVKHVDRTDISITVTICLESTINKDWPIWAEINGEDVFYNTNVGDGVLLTHSHETIHWRDKLICDENERVVQLFYHWRDVTNTSKTKKTLL